jgi:hypothetical protein
VTDEAVILNRDELQRGLASGALGVDEFSLSRATKRQRMDLMDSRDIL